MPWFGSKRSEPAPPVPAPAPPLTDSPLPSVDGDTGTCFRLTGAFWVTGMGSLVTGFLVAGTMRVGQRLQVFQARTGTLLPQMVEVEGIEQKNPHPSRVILSRYDGVLPTDRATAGPGLVGIRVKGIARGSVVKGDLLVSPGTVPDPGSGPPPPA